MKSFDVHRRCSRSGVRFEPRQDGREANRFAARIQDRIIAVPKRLFRDQRQNDTVTVLGQNMARCMVGISGADARGAATR